MQVSKVKASFEAYALYLLTGVACVTIGGSMPQLVEHFDTTVSAIAVLGSCFAFGRVATVFITGYLTEKYGPKWVVVLGSVCLLVFLLGLPHTKYYPVGVILSVLGGIGMGTQDATCPVMLGAAFPKAYASAMSAGQAFFGIGSFLLPLVMSIVLALSLPFQCTFYVLAVIPIMMLLYTPFAHFPKAIHSTEVQKEATTHQQALPIANKKLAYISFGVICFSYCAVVSTIALYTSSFMGSLGLSESRAVSILSLYNIGSMCGSALFVLVLRKVHTTTVLCMNAIGALICFVTILLTENVGIIIIGFIGAGFLLGVLFSVIITLSTGLSPKHASMAAAVVAIVGGGADVVSPFITGKAVGVFGIRFTIVYIVGMLGVTVLSGLLFRYLYRYQIKRTQ